MCFPLSKSKRAHAKHFGANICHLKHRLFAPLLRPEDLCYRPEARLLRMVCGATCNCTDPYTNAWWKVTWMQCVKPFLHLKICTHCCQRWWFGNGNSFKTQQFGLFTCSSCFIQNIYTEKNIQHSCYIITQKMLMGYISRDRGPSYWLPTNLFEFGDGSIEIAWKL